MFSPSHSNKLRKSSKKYLQPPTLSNSNLYSSHDRNEEYMGKFNELSNVEENSYHSS